MRLADPIPAVRKDPGDWALDPSRGQHSDQKLAQCWIQVGVNILIKSDPVLNPSRGQNVDQSWPHLDQSRGRNSDQKLSPFGIQAGVKTLIKR